MQYYNNKLSISYNELVPDIFSKPNYDYYKSVKKITVLRRGCKDTPALIEYSTLPPRIKDAVKEKYGSDVVEMALRNPLEKYLENDLEAYDFFSTYVKPDGKMLEKDKVREYTGNAVALNAIIRLFEDKKARNRSIGSKVDVKMTYETILKALQALQGEWGWKMPTSERALRIKITSYRKDKYESLIHGGIGNENSAKVAENEQEAVLRMLLRNPKNFNNREIQMMYNEMAKSAGWKSITDKNIIKLREKWKMFIEPGRRGDVHFMNNFAMQAKRSDPFYPMMYWTLDGWEAELMYQKTFNNAAGKSITTYHNRLRIVVILDVYKKYPIGYAIGEQESADLIKKALRNALKHTQELFGCIYRPQQVQSDRFSVKETGNFLDSITPKFTPAKAKNAKSKRIENWFDKFNMKHCRWEKNWSGHNVTAKADNQPNVDYINAVKKDFPDKEGCIRQLTDFIETERKELKEAYVERFKELPNDYKLPWTTEQFLYHAGKTTGYTNRMTGPGLIITINNEKRTYDSFDLNFRRYTHVDWAIKYDTSDLKTVLAANEDGTLRFLLEEKYVQPIALIDRKQEDSAEFAKLNQFNKKLNEIVEEVEFADKGATDFLFATRPELNDTLAKMQITDSYGQHKNYRQSKAVENGHQLLLDQEKHDSKDDKRQEREQNRIAAKLEADKQAAINEYHANKIDINEFLED